MSRPVDIVPIASIESATRKGECVHGYTMLRWCKDCGYENMIQSLRVEINKLSYQMSCKDRALSEKSAKVEALTEVLTEVQKDVARAAVNNVVWPNTLRMMDEVLGADHG